MAIAVDTTSAGQGTGTTLTVSHTCTGSNLILWVAAFCQTSDTLTGITYNSVAMTQVNKVASSVYGDVLYLYALAGPSTGAHNIVMSSSTSKFMMMSNCSYTGAAQSGIPDSSAIQNTLSSQSGITLGSTVVAANSWQVMNARNDIGAWTAGTGTVIRGTPTASGNTLFDSNGALSAGSHNLVGTCGGGAHVEGLIASFAPFVASTAKGNFLMFM